MHDQLIQSVVEEVRAKSADHFLGRIFQPSPLSFALDFGIKGCFLFISAEPSSPRFYLIRRRSRDLERLSIGLSHFGQLMKAQLGGGQLLSITKDTGERVVRLTFRVVDELDGVHFRRLVAQLTGRAANLFVLDELNRVKAALRFPKGAGQSPGEYYLSPPTQRAETRGEVKIVSSTSPSEAADLYFQKLDAERQFDSHVATLRGQLRKRVEQKKKLLSNLENDLATHGEADKHKRLGDLLLANLSTAVREDNKTSITDFYTEGSPTIEIELDRTVSLQDAASQYFRQYTKAKRAREEITERITTLQNEIESLQQQQRELQEIAENRDEESLKEFDKPRQKAKAQAERKTETQIPGVRRYLSTDGYQILVGRGARDNDNLTFRIARPNDLWLHAGDYPGSHVVIRNPTKKEIPQRTVIEAAQLAGRFSRANEDTKVVIHYTERKFLSKPKGAALGLVRLSKFKSMTVEPKESVERI
jgi:predicted ribosome quality control (RQC) complex YloA/Tae2 family protein